MAAAAAGYGTTAVYYTVSADAASRFPSLLDWGLFAFYPLAFGALVAFVRQHVVGVSVAVWIDAAVGALVAAAIGSALLVPQFEGEYNLAIVGQFLFFFGDLSFLGFLVVAYAVSGWRGGASLKFLVAGALSLAVGDGVYAVAVAQGDTVPGLLPAVAWPLGALLLAAAPVQKMRGAPPSSSRWAKIGVPAASAIACLPILFFASGGTLHNSLASVALALIVVRLTLSLIDNMRLLRTVEAAAVTDPLTGLGNRQLLLDRLEHALLRHVRRGGRVAVLFLDLDEFKAINDAHGHDVGDEVLIAVAERLRDATRGEDTVARDVAAGESRRSHDTIGRLGGDEFVVVLEALADASTAAAVAERILAAVREPLIVAGHELVFDASVGVALSDNSCARGATELLRDADTAMYAAKRSGKGRYLLFQSEMHDEVIASTQLVRDLRSAVAEDQLRLLYQPQIDLVSGRMTGVEALVRWEHPERGLVTPDRFIPMAETTGLIVAIDDWVLREACAQLRAWDEAGLPPLDMAVNVSASRLVSGDLAGAIDAALRETGVGADRLEIEITETVAVDHDDAAVSAITRVRALGVRTAIDDFGMGQSALSRLQTFPVDRLKIDRSFVAPLTDGTAHGSIADAMIAMGHSLGLRVLAEGVETHEHLRALRALGCSSAQGYLFSKPVPSSEIERLAHVDGALAPADDLGSLVGLDRETASRHHERLIRNLLGELERLTGLESTYVTRIDWEEAAQHITHARNTGAMDIPEGLTVDWLDTVCRRALEQGVTYTDDVPSSFPDSAAAAELGLQTYVSVPLRNDDGAVAGTLCGASSRRVELGPEALQVVERFAQLISGGVARQCRQHAPTDDRSPVGRPARAVDVARSH